jgi:hypothetical protein
MSATLQAIDDLAKTLILDNYASTSDELIALYERAKGRQWNASTELAWDSPPPADGNIIAEEMGTLYGTALYDALSAEQKHTLNRREAAWVLSQFLHGEQASLLACGQLMAALPEMDSKFYAASQGYDEARHVEVYRAYLLDRLGMLYPPSENLVFITETALGSPEWTMKLVGTQLVVESLAMGAFKTLLDAARDPLLQDLLKYVMQDEARHVAFGRIALKRAIAELSESERADYEDFVYYSSEVMASGFVPYPVFEECGIEVDDALLASIYGSEQRRRFRNDLFSVLLPHAKAVGLLTDRIRPKYAALGILDYELLEVEGE